LRGERFSTAWQRDSEKGDGWDCQMATRWIAGLALSVNTRASLTERVTVFVAGRRVMGCETEPAMECEKELRLSGWLVAQYVGGLAELSHMNI
jgi:hypothetical protein